jgi:NADPH:quinone reductase-like Zn-dependent oxidoreductase
VKAIVRETYGPPDVLHLEEVPLPTVGDGDVLVRVQAPSAPEKALALKPANLSFEEAAALPTLAARRFKVFDRDG